jgi:predicted PurR-regulated permease PerM
VPAVAIAAIEAGPWMGVVVVALYIVIQQLENNFIVPKVMQDNADVNPLIAIISILIGFKLNGVIGGLLAVPTYILVRTIFSTWKRLSEGKV